MKVLIFVNRQYLTKALKFRLATLELIDPMSSMLFSHGGRHMIVMPTRAENPSPITTAGAVQEPITNDPVEFVKSGRGLTNYIRQRQRYRLERWMASQSETLRAKI